MVVAAAFVDMASDDVAREAAAAKLGRTTKLVAEPRIADRAIKCDFILVCIELSFVNCEM